MLLFSAHPGISQVAPCPPPSLPDPGKEPEVSGFCRAKSVLWLLCLMSVGHRSLLWTIKVIRFDFFSFPFVLMWTCLYIQVSVLYVHVCVGKSIWVHTCVCVSVGQSLTSSVSPSCSFSQSLFTKSDYPGGPASPRRPPDPAFQALGFKPATLHLFFFFLQSCWGSKLRSFCVCGEHFTESSPQPQLDHSHPHAWWVYPF